MLFQSFVTLFILALATATAAVPVATRPRARNGPRSCKAPAAVSAVVSFAVAPTATAPGTEEATTLLPPKADTTTAPAPPATTSVHSSSSRSSTRTSSAAPTASPTDDDDKPPTSPSTGGLSGLLFPVKTLNAWSTADGVDGHVSLSDATFRQTSEIKELTHKYVDFEGKKAMQAHYPKGSYNFQHQPRGGISFYAPGPANVDLTTAKEATFGYSVYFPKGFDFNKGGKLPGLYGGDSAEQAISCSGGSRDNACQSVRLMWRTNGAGEFYTYLPPSFDANKRVCDVKPQSECNSVYGASVGRGSFTFKTGSWNTVAERVKLNDVGKENGEIELFVEGKSVVKVTGLVLRDNAQGKLRGIMMQTFFGGSTAEWASPRDQDVYFADFSVGITQKL